MPIQEVKGNLWDFSADFTFITTNGYVRKDGAAVMGRGCALEAKQRYPGVEFQFGTQLACFGNHVQWIRDDLFSFPVKHYWRDKANLELIKRSANEVIELLDEYAGVTCVIPRPGCGNGQRDWKTEVKPILEPIFDERIFVISYG